MARYNEAVRQWNIDLNEDIRQKNEERMQKHAERMQKHEEKMRKLDKGTD